jgi:hypothetical protein
MCVPRRQYNFSWLGEVGFEHTSLLKLIEFPTRTGSMEERKRAGFGVFGICDDIA